MHTTTYCIVSGERAERHKRHFDIEFHNENSVLFKIYYCYNCRPHPLRLIFKNDFFFISLLINKKTLIAKFEVNGPDKVAYSYLIKTKKYVFTVQLYKITFKNAYESNIFSV